VTFCVYVLFLCAYICFERAVEVHRDMVDFDVHEMLLVGCSLKPLWKDETKRRYGATLMNLLLKRHLL
jgi:hypothetical protein